MQTGIFLRLIGGDQSNLPSNELLIAYLLRADKNSARRGAKTNRSLLAYAPLYTYPSQDSKFRHSATSRKHLIYPTLQIHAV